MGLFGWAHISDALKPAKGPDKSLQFASGSDGYLSGSKYLTFDHDQQFLALTGSMEISGTIKANVFDVITTVRTEIEVGGNTNFGDSSADEHVFTGSVSIVSGGLRQHYHKLTATSYTASVADSIIGVSSSAYVSVTIPSASVAGQGKLLIIKDEWYDTRTDVNHIAISASGADKIDHLTSYSLSGDSAALSIYSDGVSKWFIY